MADYHRRDRGKDGYEYGRYSQEDSYRGDRGRDRRDGRYSPPRSPPGARSRERYLDHDRDDYAYDRDDGDYRDDSRDRDPARQPREWDSRPTDPFNSQEARPSEYLAPGVSLHQQSDDDRDSGQHWRHPRGDAYDAGKASSQIIFRGLDKEVSETDVLRTFHIMLFRTIANLLFFGECSCRVISSTSKTLPLNP
jgi:hypothetical protein